MLAELADFMRDRPHSIEIFDIDSDPELQVRYAARIPLLMLGETLVAEYFLDEEHLAAVLRGESAGN